MVEMGAATTQRKEIKGKERIRGPNLVVLVKHFYAPFVEGFAKADRENRVIASNKRLDKALIGSREWEGIGVRAGGFPCFSGTMTGYEKPGKKLGKYVVYTDPKTNQRHVFPVPEDYKGTKNAILAVEHPDYTLEKDGKDRVVAVQNIENIDLIERFPSGDGWYHVDAKHGIPTEDEVLFYLPHKGDDVRYLTRWNSGVSPIVRGDMFTDDFQGRSIIIYSSISNKYGIVVEAPAEKSK